MIYKIVKKNEYELLEVCGCARNFPAHIHKRLCVGKVNSGEKYITIDGQTSKYSEGEMFIIEPFAAHSCESKAKASYTILSIGGDTDINIEAILNDLAKTDFDPKTIGDIILASRENNRHKKREALSDLPAYIDEHYSDRLTIKNIAEKIGYSPYYALRLFKQAFGISIHQYLIQTRVKRSKTLNSDCGMSRIAIESGFYDQSHFIRCFKKYEGVTPKKYYNSVQNV
ncbi:MAG: AraC family transcriptional regulator [Helicobacteraceae bacterium]|nr:AraC family transcriptional regulator [Helicobacteraceae bacterium]